MEKKQMIKSMKSWMKRKSGYWRYKDLNQELIYNQTCVFDRFYMTLSSNQTYCFNCIPLLIFRVHK